MSTHSIFCLSHKPFTHPTDPIYKPLSVFCDEGDNIADKNCYYSELTGVYWAWKNSDADIIGICHYRRYLLNEEGSLYTKSQIDAILKDYDIITTKLLTLNFSYEYGFSKNHKPYYLQELEKLLKEKYPKVYPVYKKLVKEKHTYFGNMMISKRALFDDYCSFLFGILFDLESRIVIDEPDSYHRRIFGFISEFLLYVYIELKGLRVKHSMVGMLGEKTEVYDIKKELGSIILSGDIQGAKEYFLSQYKSRPDILMEASDIGWELHYLMEAISIAEHEIDAGKVPFCNNMLKNQEIYDYLRTLNAWARGEQDLDFVPSDEAIYVAKTLVEGSGTEA